MNFLPAAILGAGIAVVVTGKRRKRSGKKKKLQGYPTEVHSAPDLPDLIEGKRGDRFSVRLYDDINGAEWRLVGLPPDGSVRLDQERRVASGGEVCFDFTCIRKGGGALVFHQRAGANPDEPQPAADVVDIQVSVLR